MNDDSNKITKARIAAGILVSTIGFGICFWLSSLLTSLIFHYTGTPTNPWPYIITGLLGLYIFAASVKLIAEIRDKGHDHRGRKSMMDDTLDAMRRISQGDFSVVMKVNEHDPFPELANTVNKMAQELGSMEKLRQDFIANVSHEIQSPLTSISGFANLLRSKEITEEDRIHYLDIIESESKRLSKLSDNLLKLSSLDAAATPLLFTDFRLDKQLQNSVLMLEPQWSEKNLDISMELDAATVSGDEHLMAQVWINLLHNSIKFTPEGGSINITMSSGDAWVICRITDSGIGISEEDKLHIFERFYKVDKARDRSLGGNGLGLSLVKKIVELHKGNIEIESELGTGTSFIIKLPK